MHQQLRFVVAPPSVDDFFHVLLCGINTHEGFSFPTVSVSPLSSVQSFSRAQHPRVVRAVDIQMHGTARNSCTLKTKQNEKHTNTHTHLKRSH